MRFVFATEASDDLAHLRAEMAERLLHRGIARPSRYPRPEAALEVRASRTRENAASTSDHAASGPESAAPTLPVPQVLVPRGTMDTPRAKVRGGTMIAQTSTSGIPLKASEPRPGATSTASVVPSYEAIPRRNESAPHVRVLLTELDPAPKVSPPRLHARVQKSVGLSRAPMKATPQFEAEQAPGCRQPLSVPRHGEPATAAAWPSTVRFSLVAPARPGLREPAPQTKAQIGHTAMAPAQEHDWLAEIAQALADECDLRGIDA